MILVILEKLVALSNTLQIVVSVVPTAQPCKKKNWVVCLVDHPTDVCQQPYLLQIRNSLLQSLGLLVFPLPDHVLLLLVQETDHVSHFGVLVHVKGQVVQGGDGLTFAGWKTGYKVNRL